MRSALFGYDGTPISRDGNRLMVDGEPVAIRRCMPDRERAEGLIPDTEEELRRNEEKRRRARDHRRANRNR